MEENILLEIASMIKKSLIAQLNIPKPVRTYDGRQKTVDGVAVPAQKSIASGNLIKNLNVYWISGLDEGKPELVIEMPDYYFFIENGRRPGRYPPLRVIQQWARVKKGIQKYRDKKGRFIKNETRAFLMARSIAQYGYAPRPFIDGAIESILPKITDDLGGAAALFLQNTLNESRILTGQFK